MERNCELASWLGEQIEVSDAFELLAPVRLNGICFTIATGKVAVSLEVIKEYLNRLKESGDVFLTPTVYQEKAAIRVSIANWSTTQADVEISWQAMCRVINAYHQTPPD